MVLSLSVVLWLLRLEPMSSLFVKSILQPEEPIFQHSWTVKNDIECCPVSGIAILRAHDEISQSGTDPHISLAH